MLNKKKANTKVTNSIFAFYLITYRQDGCFICNNCKKKETQGEST